MHAARFTLEESLGGRRPIVVGHKGMNNKKVDDRGGPKDEEEGKQ